MTGELEPVDESGELLPGSQSIVQVKIGQRTFDMVRHTRCAVCMHPGRYAIEEKILLNFGYPAIVRFVSETQVQKNDGTIEHWPPLTRMQLINHRDKGHIPLNAEMIRALAERRAQQEGINLEDYTGQFVDHVVANDIVLERGLERLVKGEIQPDVKDLLSASKLKADLEARNQQMMGEAQMQELMILYFRTVQKVVTEGQWKQIMAEISGDPTYQKFREQRVIDG